MEFNELIRERFSCRALSDKEIPHESMNRIFEAARLAPTAVNKQPIHFWVLKSSEAMKKLAETTHFVFGAPVAIVVGSKAEEAWVRSFDEKNFAEVDASIAATHMMLEAEDLGLGTTWVGHFDAPKMKKLFPEMAGFELSCVLPIGYPTDDAVPSTRHAERKGTEALVSWL